MLSGVILCLSAVSIIWIGAKIINWCFSFADKRNKAEFEKNRLKTASEIEILMQKEKEDFFTKMCEEDYNWMTENYIKYGDIEHEWFVDYEEHNYELKEGYRQHKLLQEDRFMNQYKNIFKSNGWFVDVKLIGSDKRKNRKCIVRLQTTPFDDISSKE